MSGVSKKMFLSPNHEDNGNLKETGWGREIKRKQKGERKPKVEPKKETKVLKTILEKEEVEPSGVQNGVSKEKSEK